MSAKRKAFKVRSGNDHITVAPWTHPSSHAERWRYAFRETPASPWKYRLFRTRTEAENSAIGQLEKSVTERTYLEDLPPGRRRWLEDISRSVAPEDERKVLDFIAAMTRSAEIGGAVTRFLHGKTSKAGEETPHLGSVRGVLEHLSEKFRGRGVAEIHLPELREWFDARTEKCGWKRCKDIRGSVVQFFRWCRKEGIAGADHVTVADRLPEIGGRHGDREFITPEQFSLLRDAVTEDFRPWLILGCFAGLRPEEIAPCQRKKAGKRGLHCEEIDWRFGVIRIAPEVSKVGLPRVVPLNDACRAGLAWAGIAAGMTGPVCLRNATEAGEAYRLGNAVFGGRWPQDICRHSYATYRNAIVRNLGQVAEEMGTSVAMLHRHYHNPRATEEGERWFAIRPGVPICSDENRGTGQSEENRYCG